MIKGVDADELLHVVGVSAKLAVGSVVNHIFMVAPIPPPIAPPILKFEAVVAAVANELKRMANSVVGNVISTLKPGRIWVAAQPVLEFAAD